MSVGTEPGLPQSEPNLSATAAHNKKVNIKKLKIKIHNKTHPDNYKLFYNHYATMTKGELVYQILVYQIH